MQQTRFIQSTSDYLRLPCCPIAYWVSKQTLSIFDYRPLSFYASIQEGLKTSINELFIRYWYEVNVNQTNVYYQNQHGKKWVKHTKGGPYRKWYGNCIDVLNYENNGYELKHLKTASITGESNYFKESISWSRISSTTASFRFTNAGSIPNMAGLALYPSSKPLQVISFLNSVVTPFLLHIINPTLNNPPGTISSLPYIPISDESVLSKTIETLAEKNISICSEDWNCFEESWDFRKHPLV